MFPKNRNPLRRRRNRRHCPIPNRLRPIAAAPTHAPAARYVACALASHHHPSDCGATNAILCANPRYPRAR